MSETTYGREPLVIVELTQKRCSLRFGFTPCNATLVDLGLRTNFALHSQAFDNAYWGKARVTVGVDAAAAPDGTMTAERLTETAATGLHNIGRSFDYTSGIQYTWSAHVKAETRTRCLLALPAAAFGSNQQARFDLEAATATSVSGSPAPSIEALPDGWYRVSITATATATASGNAEVRMIAVTSSSYAGDGVSSLLIWGAQLEIGSPVSSYKATTTETVTRRDFGSLAKCYQTWGTCGDKTNRNSLGLIKWRFRKPGAGILPMFTEAGNDIATNPIPLLVDVSTTSSAINSGAQREGQSPLGIRATCTVTLQDAPWDDHVGDYYLADRSGVRGNFWAKWKARNAFYADMVLSIYEGYRGQALGDMQRRDYILDGVAGPDASGRVTLSGKDPLRLAQLKEAQFPRATDIRLVGDITDSATAITVRAFENDLSDVFGNTAPRKFLRFGEEIIQYTGYAASGDNWTLSGVTRGVLGSIASAQATDAAGQRVGRYDTLPIWEAGADLIDNHTPIPAGYRDTAGWLAEGSAFMPASNAERTVVAPVAVETLLGQVCQEGSLSIWWDERERLVKLLANRPPNEALVVIDDRLNILEGTAQCYDDTEAHTTRVVVFYEPRNPFQLDRPENYKEALINIDGEVEAAADSVRTLTIYAKWITGFNNVFRLSSRILLRYRLIPNYLRIELDAKDRAIKIGDVLEVTTGAFVNSEGEALSTRWQVVSAEEHRPGDAIRLQLQSYSFVGRFMRIMADTATADYASATDAEKAVGGYMCEDATGLMPGGDPPYLIA